MFDIYFFAQIYDSTISTPQPSMRYHDDDDYTIIITMMVMMIIIIVSRRDDFIIPPPPSQSNIITSYHLLIYYIHNIGTYQPTYLPTITYIRFTRAGRPSVVQVYSYRSERLVIHDVYDRSIIIWYNRYCFSLIFYIYPRIRTFVSDVVVILDLKRSLRCK